ncbi:hypothetical protein [Brucella sp. IR073]|uniref:hypothetical protein n=1 Tax=unclassified Brucella TaxID=2632610 RepID=UPI003B9842A2
MPTSPKSAVPNAPSTSTGASARTKIIDDTISENRAQPDRVIQGLLKAKGISRSLQAIYTRRIMLGILSCTECQEKIYADKVKKHKTETYGQIIDRLRNEDNIEIPAPAAKRCYDKVKKEEKEKDEAQSSGQQVKRPPDGVQPRPSPVTWTEQDQRLADFWKDEALELAGKRRSFADIQRFFAQRSLRVPEGFINDILREAEQREHSQAAGSSAAAQSLQAASPKIAGPSRPEQGGEAAPPSLPSDG